jgi:hypothetical protein
MPGFSPDLSTVPEKLIVSAMAPSLFCGKRYHAPRAARGVIPADDLL